MVRYNVGTGETRLWIDPASEFSPGINALDTPSPSTIGAFTFRQNSGMGGVCVDDLKIGTSFSDVAQTRPMLTISRSGGNLSISWGGVGTLQYSDGLTAPPASISWQSLPGAPNPYTTTTASPASRFYRVTVP